MCTVLYNCTMCTVLYKYVQHSTNMCNTVQNGAAFSKQVQHWKNANNALKLSASMYKCVQNCTIVIQCCTTLYKAVYHCIKQKKHCTTLYNTVQCCTMLYNSVQCIRYPYGMVWYHFCMCRAYCGHRGTLYSRSLEEVTVCDPCCQGDDQVFSSFPKCILEFCRNLSFQCR